MQPNLAGSPKSVVQASDVATLLANVLKGRFCVQIATQRGIPNVPTLVSNWLDFKRKMGGTLSGIDGTRILKRALDKGAVFYVSRVAHYSDITDPSTIAHTKSSGTLTVSSDSVVFAGKEVGPAYAVVVTVTAAKSGTSGKVDVKYSLPAFPELDETYLDVTAALGTTEKNKINALSKLVSIGTVTLAIPVGTVTLSGGTYDVTTFADSDYIGDQEAKTGVWSFNSVLDALRLVNFERPSSPVDVVYNSYCASRKNMRAWLRFPIGLTPEGAGDYMNAAGAFTSNVIINDWYSKYTYGDITIVDTEDPELQQVTIPGIGDEVGNRAITDQLLGEWISHAGGTRGLISNAISLLHNIGSPADSATYDTLYEKGFNAIINHETFGIVYWGNRTNLKDNTKLLSKDNIADLMIVVIRFMKLAADKQLFNPDDPQMWGELYRQAKAYIKDTLERGRAIRKTEGKNWFWLGDQNADDADQVQFNLKSDIDAGKYRARFVFIPIPATEYIGIEATATDQNSVSIAVVNG